MNNTLAELKEAGEDFEWYPTTDVMINAVKSSLEKENAQAFSDFDILDIGAGDGRVLAGLTDGRKYAIEKAVPLIEALPPNIYIVGTDFWKATLIDKNVDVIFCNPPYSEYESWASKIILEANAQFVLLVMPTRWERSPVIQNAIKKRDAKVSIIGTFDFLRAERKARAKINIVKLKIKSYHGGCYTDPFDLWFDAEFNYQKASEGFTVSEAQASETLRKKLEGAVVAGKGRVPSLVNLYDHEMEHLYGNYQQICSLDAALLKELGVDKRTLREALKLRITGLKNRYWKELFDNMSDITSRLTVKSRRKMLNTLTAQTNVDFTESNIYAILIWAIKNANQYFDSQLIDTVEQMVGEANIKNYKSNERVYSHDQWRYSMADMKEHVSHFGLELRIVLERHYAIATVDSWGVTSSYDYPEGLHRNAHDFINDLLTIANNLGFSTWPNHNSHTAGKKDKWESGKTKEFYDTDGESLMFVKAFKNGNLHIKFNKKFIKRLNVEFGRLKGWLKNAQQASDELNISVRDASKAFQTNRQITASNVKLISG